MVGTVQDLVFEPKRGATCGWLYVFQMVEGGRKFHLLHKTKMPEIPGAMCEYGGVLRCYSVMNSSRAVFNFSICLPPTPVPSISLYVLFRACLT